MKNLVLASAASLVLAGCGQSGGSSGATDPCEKLLGAWTAKASANAAVQSVRITSDGDRTYLEMDGTGPEAMIGMLSGSCSGGKMRTEGSIQDDLSYDAAADTFAFHGLTFSRGAAP